MKLSYRTEIDGLRAIAVGAVILYHAQITIFGHQLFKGGFIGVDIFFVISGYLITSIILKELVITGSFSFIHFYERRVRRILPALLFVMVLSLPFAWILLLPSNFIDFSKSILYSLGFSSNFYFWHSGEQYSNDQGLFKQFLHTWSLSVEEQYYIIFPIVLLITFKYFRKYLIHILIFGFIVSLELAQWTSKNYPSISFYFIHTRMWELLAGSMLAYFEITIDHRSENKLLNFILPPIGLLLIGHSILFFNDQMFHPSFFTLSPIVGVCLIIWFSNKKEIITKILSSKLFVGIGLISYSLYLWHYPIFSFIKISGLVTGSMTGKLLIIPLLFIISLISYRFIEKPFRNKKNNTKNILLVIFALFFFLILFNLYVVYNYGIKTRIPEYFQIKLKEENTYFHQKNNTRKVVLIGDSHADALEFILNDEIKKKNLSLIRFNTRMYLNNFNYVHKKTKKVDREFIDKNIKIENFLKENSNLIVVLHHRWTLRFLETYFDNGEGIKEYNASEYDSFLEHLEIKTSSKKERQQLIKKALRSQINNIVNQGHKLVLVYPVPEMGISPYKYLFRNYVFNNSIPIFSGSYEIYKNRNKLIFEIFDTIDHPSIYRVYPHKFFCDKQLKNRCVANDKNNIFYYDDDHLSIQGSKPVVDAIMKEIEKINLNLTKLYSLHIV